VETFDPKAVAREVITSLATRSQVPTFTSRSEEWTLGDAYRVSGHIRSAFEARGERIVGRKIGFTNRKLWEVYRVKHPIWGYATDHTTFELAQTEVQFAKNFVEPRLEPEIMFGLKAAPSPDMSESALLDCIEWVSLGYEIVQSIYADWKFAAPDGVAANSLHGALLVGNRQAILPRKTEWQTELANFEIELYCNGELSQRGGGTFVLGSPLLALQHLVKVLATDTHNPPLRAGEIVSTGTLTLAMPIKPGEHWTTKISGIPLKETSIRIE
jgi:2-keto-4-pentenoate hydratase